MWFNLKCVNPLTDKYKPEELLDFLVSDLPLKKKKKKMLHNEFFRHHKRPLPHPNAFRYCLS